MPPRAELLSSDEYEAVLIQVADDYPVEAAKLRAHVRELESVNLFATLLREVVEGSARTNERLTDLEVCAQASTAALGTLAIAEADRNAIALREAEARSRREEARSYRGTQLIALAKVALQNRWIVLLLGGLCVWALGKMGVALEDLPQLIIPGGSP